MPINTSRKGYTAPGTKHEPTIRKGVGGRPVPREQLGRTWQDFIAPGPKPTDTLTPANLRARDLIDAPERTVVLTPSADVPAPVAGQPRRRDRRPIAIAAAQAERRRSRQ